MPDGAGNKNMVREGKGRAAAWGEQAAASPFGLDIPDCVF
jgi:hypothetical protein